MTDPSPARHTPNALRTSYALHTPYAYTRRTPAHTVRLRTSYACAAGPHTSCDPLTSYDLLISYDPLISYIPYPHVPDPRIVVRAA
ncbi:hypothetical protein PV416_43285 [Streptomyces ipomoeae]|uniref:hypothetical protein n=1 Tax=Streptomyces ipomoeae TaxID=103232 RepID=UPI000312DDA2|nr:hypothetical protein [Streptomyces ipomoeae]MDX2700171.1 hypothetical protein [Streptomyces ipomoeae]MDX2827704.1 hypothetical protein [Streptomyces ipomoeae]MDX2842914.1 hypothetical protein [Streptomyces ipomoeae]MDX2876890.1 hypothetical protein [Streptomyces ipomoeae]